MINKKKVLYLSYDGLTDPLGQSQIIPYLAGLSHRGFQITIVSFEKPARYAVDKKTVTDLCVSFGFSWVPLVYHKNPPVVSTLFDLWRLRRKVKAMQEANEFNIVHCRSYITSLVGLWMKRTYKLRFIFDMRGFWADERVEGGLWNLKNPLFRVVYNFFKTKEREFLQEADAVVTLTNASKAYLMENVRNLHSGEKISVIPCSVDLELFDPANIDDHDKRNLRAQLNIRPDDFVLLYLGSLGTWYLYEQMVSFFDNSIRNNFPESKFLWLTPDIDKVSKREDFIVKTVKRNEVPLYASIANATIFFIKPSFSKMASSATKMAEVMAMGLPVITNNGWGDVDFFSRHCSGIFVNGQFTAHDLTEFFKQSGSSVVRKYAGSEFSLESAINKYENVYDALT
jgi:glycosyltransferase involved in cell wall biosynthesis